MIHSNEVVAYSISFICPSPVLINLNLNLGNSTVTEFESHYVGSTPILITAIYDVSILPGPESSTAFLTQFLSLLGSVLISVFFASCLVCIVLVCLYRKHNRS